MSVTVDSERDNISLINILKLNEKSAMYNTWIKVFKNAYIFSESKICAIELFTKIHANFNSPRACPDKTVPEKIILNRKIIPDKTVPKNRQNSPTQNSPKILTQRIN